MGRFHDVLIDGNAPLDYGIALATFAALVLAIALFARLVPFARRLRRKREAGLASELDVYLLQQLERTVLPLGYAGALFIAISTLHLDVGDRAWLRGIALVALAWASVRIGLGAFQVALANYIARTGATGANMRAFAPFVSVLAWGFAIVFVLDDLGFRVSAIVTGLGIGGVAVALAAQSLLKDWFGYLAIVSDRPFEIGHLVGIGADYTGTIDAIGVRSVRLRSISGEEITIPNSDVATARVRNYTRMRERRVVFTLVAAHATSEAQLGEILGLVRAAIEAQPLARFVRSYLVSITDAGFVFENAYDVLSSDFDAYARTQQAISLAVVAAFRTNAIAIAGTPLAVDAAAPKSP